jgi:hypothetical protein
MRGETYWEKSRQHEEMREESQGRRERDTLSSKAMEQRKPKVDGV